MFRTPIDAASVRCWLYGPHATALSAETVGAGEGMGEGMSRVARVRLGEAVPVKVQGEMVRGETGGRLGCFGFVRFRLHKNERNPSLE